VILSVMAGVTAPTLAEGIGGWPIVRVMPTTGVSRGRGVASIWSADDRARSIGRGLFEPMAETVVLADEALMDAATAVAGSGAAYFYAFTEALARAGEAADWTRRRPTFWLARPCGPRLTRWATMGWRP
jgi:pyrroline-5-carboxylate reductase